MKYKFDFALDEDTNSFYQKKEKIPKKNKSVSYDNYEEYSKKQKKEKSNYFKK